MPYAKPNLASRVAMEAHAANPLPSTHDGLISSMGFTAGSFAQPPHVQLTTAIKITRLFLFYEVWLSCDKLDATWKIGISQPMHRPSSSFIPIGRMSTLPLW